MEPVNVIEFFLRKEFLDNFFFSYTFYCIQYYVYFAWYLFAENIFREIKNISTLVFLAVL